MIFIHLDFQLTGAVAHVFLQIAIQAKVGSDVILVQPEGSHDQSISERGAYNKAYQYP